MNYTTNITTKHGDNMVQVGDLYHCKIMDNSGQYFIAMVTKITDDYYHPITLTCVATHADYWKVGETTTRCYNTIHMIGRKIT